MRALFQLLIAPVAAIALVLMLGMAEGINDGTVPFSVGVVVALVMIAVEVVVFKIIDGKEGSENEENPDV